MIPTEEESCKCFLRAMHDEIKTQLVALRFKEFLDLSERAKMVEQSLGLNKKFEPSHTTGKHFGILNLPVLRENALEVLTFSYYGKMLWNSKFLFNT